MQFPHCNCPSNTQQPLVSLLMRFTLISWFRLLHCKGSLLCFIINNCLVDGYHINPCYSLGFQFVIYLYLDGWIISHFIQSVIIYYNLNLDAQIAPVWPVGVPVNWLIGPLGMPFLIL